MSTTVTDIAVRNGQAAAALAIRPGQEMFSDKQRAALAVLGIKGASNADLAVYMHYCQKTGLDPFSRQIYMIERAGKQTIQVGIDGFRVIRDRIAKREGLTIEYGETIWYDASGVEHKVWLWDEAPAACRVDVYKNGQLFPGVVRTAAYMAMKDGKPVSQWKTQADHMIEKCAEAFALRRAFPHDLGGMYIDEELPPVPAQMEARPARVTAAEIVRQPVAAEVIEEGPADPPRDRAGKTATAKLDTLLRKFPFQPEDVTTLLEWYCGGPYRATRDQAGKVTAYLEKCLADAQGDTEEAASAIWAQYRAATEQDAAEDSQETEGGSDGQNPE